MSARTLNKTESRSLPKDLDELVLPPTFFNDSDGHDAVHKKQRTATVSRPQSAKKEHNTMRMTSVADRGGGGSMTPDMASIKVSGRNRSRSLDTLHAEHRMNAHSRLIHGVLVCID